MSARDLFSVVDETDERVTPEAHAEESAALRLKLLELQRALLEADYPVLILLNGVDGAGKGETGNLLHDWLDGRFLERRVFEARSEPERRRPKRWRDWMATPKNGSIGVFFGSWYSEPILQRAYGELDDDRFEQEMRDCVAFEEVLADSGALIIKLWFHLSKEQQRARLKALQEHGTTRWRVTRTDWRHFKLYDRFRRVCSSALAKTEHQGGPWTLISGEDPQTRDLTVARHLVTRLEAHAHTRERQRSKDDKPRKSKARSRTVLDEVDLDAKLKKKAYRKRLPEAQDRLYELSYDAYTQGQSVVLAFEGWDAAGKGGAIRRLMHGMDARTYSVTPVAAPNDVEKAHHYLWRFWRDLPKDGRIAIFDRSWYGRLLVERLEGFARPGEWHRSYEEIVDFERQLADHGWLVLKFWVHISNEEQLARFEARQQDPTKQHKITEEDWRNREKWDETLRAVDEMVRKTDKPHAPWHLIAGNCKRHARVSVIETVADALEQQLYA